MKKKSKFLLLALLMAKLFTGKSFSEALILAYYGLIDAKIRASDKDLPVHRPNFHITIKTAHLVRPLF